MARNIRNLAVKEYNVIYGIVENGKLVQKQAKTDTDSPRRLTKLIADANGVKNSDVVIVSTTVQEKKYKILDVVAAVELLESNGLAVIDNDATESEDEDD